MGSRGRRPNSNTAGHTEHSGNVIPASFCRRPAPPTFLTQAQCVIWVETTESEAAEFFGSAALQALLADYCRHRAQADEVSKVIDALPKELLDTVDGAKQYFVLLKIRDHESRAAAEKATKLRLTNQSRYTPQSAATATKRDKAKVSLPWEFDG